MDADTAALLLRSVLSREYDRHWAAECILESILSKVFTFKDSPSAELMTDTCEGIYTSFGVYVSLDAEDIGLADAVHDFVINIARAMAKSGMWCSIEVVRIEIRAYRFWSSGHDNTTDEATNG